MEARSERVQAISRADGAAMNAQRSVKLPLAPGDPWVLAWSPKYQSDTLPYQIDCTDWLADGGFTVASVGVSASANLTVSQLAVGLSGTNSPKLISLVIGGGAGGTTAQIGVTLSLVGGNSKYILASLPILQNITDLVSISPSSGSSGGTGTTSSTSLDPSTLLAIVL